MRILLIGLIVFLCLMLGVAKGCQFGCETAPMLSRTTALCEVNPFVD